MRCDRARRRAAFRAASAAVRSSREQEPAALRGVYSAELARFGVRDLTVEQLNEAVAAARNPVRGAKRLLCLIAGTASDLVASVRSARSASWMASPQDAEPFDWPEGATSYFAPVHLAKDSGSLLRRMLATCPSVDLPEFVHVAEPVRALELWFDRQPSGHATLSAWIGASTLGTMDGEGQRLVAKMLAAMPESRLSVEGYLIGSDVASARVVAELPAGI